MVSIKVFSGIGDYDGCCTKHMDGAELSVDAVLGECLEQNYLPMFAPDAAYARTLADKNSEIWEKAFFTASVKVTGISKQGNPVDVYAHIPNYFRNPGNIRLSKNLGLVNGASVFPLAEFYNLLDVENNRDVFVVDHDKLMNSRSGLICTEEAIEHPQTIPFLGGEKRAELYLKKCNCPIKILFKDDLSTEPLARLLYFGHQNRKDLNAAQDLDYFIGSLIGVK